MQGVSENHLKAVIPFGAMFECHLNSAQEQSRLHHFGKKVLLGMFIEYVLIAGEIWKGNIWSQTLRSWKVWIGEKSLLEGSVEKKCHR